MATSSAVARVMSETAHKHATCHASCRDDEKSKQNHDTRHVAADLLSSDDARARIHGRLRKSLSAAEPLDD